MKAGNYNVNDYINKLYEEAEGGKITDKEGLVIPDENKKVYNWLKKDYQKSQVEVKVEMKVGDSTFKPSLDLETKLDSIKEFKPGLYGDVKTKETTKEDNKENKKEFKQEYKEEEKKEEVRDEKKVDESKTKETKSNINNKKSLTINLKTKKKDDKG